MLTLRSCMFLLYLVSMLLLIACTGRSDPNATTPTLSPPSGTTSRFRLTNNSNITFDDLVVQFPGEQIAFGRVEAGVTTDYQTAQMGVYKYAAYTFTVDGKTYMQGVSDWVGETAVEGSVFTYVLSVDVNGALININLDVQRDE